MLFYPLLNLSLMTVGISLSFVEWNIFKFHRQSMEIDTTSEETMVTYVVCYLLCFALMWLRSPSIFLRYPKHFISNSFFSE